MARTDRLTSTIYDTHDAAQHNANAIHSPERGIHAEVKMIAGRQRIKSAWCLKWEYRVRIVCNHD